MPGVTALPRAELGFKHRRSGSGGCVLDQLPMFSNFSAPLHGGSYHSTHAHTQFWTMGSSVHLSVLSQHLGSLTNQECWDGRQGSTSVHGVVEQKRGSL